MQQSEQMTQASKKSSTHTKNKTQKKRQKRTLKDGASLTAEELRQMVIHSIENKTADVHREGFTAMRMKLEKYFKLYYKSLRPRIGEIERYAYDYIIENAAAFGLSDPEAVKIAELKGDPIKTGKVSANTPSTVKAKLVDPQTDKPLDSMDFTAVLKDEDGDVLQPLKVGPPKKGKYPIEVLCEKPGPHILELSVNGQPIEEVPIECVPDTEPALFEGLFTFEVHALDTDGNLKTIGGEEWSVDVVGPNDSKIEVETTDHGNGRYSAKYHLAAIEGGIAQFKVSAKLNGRHVPSSPFKEYLAPKPSLFKRPKKLY